MPRSYKHPLKMINAFFGVWVIALFALLFPQAYSQPSMPQEQLHRMVDVYPSVQISSLALLSNVDSTLRIEKIQATASQAFTELPFGQLRVSDPSWERSLWLKITLRAHEPVAKQTPSAVSILEIQKPYLDQISLYTPSTHHPSGWQVQRAGDYIAKEYWSLPSQFPRFILPTLSDLQALPGGQMVVYLHVPHRMPASFDLKVWSAAELIEDIQIDYLLLGMTLGSMLLAVLLSMALFVFHRDQLFVWYTIYAASALLACFSHSGIAFQYLWPWGGVWPSNAVLFFALIGSAAQLQFCKLMFASSTLKTWQSALCNGLSGLSVVVALTLAIVSRDWWVFAIFTSQGVIITGMLVSSILIVQACWRGNKFAMTSALTYLPLFAAVVLVMANVQGFIGLREFGYNAPLYAVALEVTLLALFLLWFGHERHGQTERNKVLAATDPLTGFATADAFQKNLQREWHDSNKQRRDMAVAYIELKTKANNRQHSEQLLKRCVRVLRSATRTQDMVARLDGQLMAIVMPQMSLGDDLSQLLSRIVALGLIPDRSDTLAPILQFRIAATTRWQFTKPIAQLDADLRTLLARPNGWGSKPIRYLESIGTQRNHINDLESNQLENFWDRALGEEIAGQAGKPNSTIAQSQQR